MSLDDKAVVVEKSTSFIIKNMIKTFCCIGIPKTATSVIVYMYSQSTVAMIEYSDLF